MKKPRKRACRVEALSGYYDALELAQLWSEATHLALLESTDTEHTSGRWTILAADPFLVFRSKREVCHAGPPGAERPLPGAPFEELQVLLDRYGSPIDVSSDTDLPVDLPFRGGVMGYLGYELLYLLEEVPNLGRDDRAVPDCYLMFFHTAVVYDARHGGLWVVGTGYGEDLASAHERACKRAARVATQVRNNVKQRPMPGRRRRVPRSQITESDLVASGIRPVVPREGYMCLVEKAKEHIRAGNIFEVCTCNRFDGVFDGTGLELYGALRQINPAPFSAYLRFPDAEVMSASPERFLRLDDERWAESRPIKGTRPRGQTQDEDERLARELAESTKDLAENIMIVDLVRNDLGRVCEFNSVVVTGLQQVESFEFTHQLVSTIRGRLRSHIGPVDLIKAAFPGGSMTGAPKIEAMKIIDELEPVKRGIFSGSIGYINFDGTFDLNIVIRTIIKSGRALHFHAGGAIVSDSDASEEHQEIIDKAAGMLATVDYCNAKRDRGDDLST